MGRGSIALPTLRRASNELTDPDTLARVARCIKTIESDGNTALPAAAARLLVLRRPAGSVEALLAYLPAVESPAVVEDVAAALAALAFADGKPHPALLAALDDSAPLRRAIAAAALCRKDQPQLLPAVRQRLRDPRPLVRLRVALALADIEDLQAFPVLIDLLADLALPQAKQAEDVLQHLAGDWAPNPTVKGDDDIARRIRRDAWAGWWHNTDGQALLTEFRRRTLSPAEQENVSALIEKLGDDGFETRQRACEDLVARGTLALPQLRGGTR